MLVNSLTSTAEAESAVLAQPPATAPVLVLPSLPTLSLGPRTAELLAGCAAGVTGKIVEYPFDTIKVLLQCQTVGGRPQYTGAVDCLIKTVRAEGAIKGLFRGFTAPLYGSIAENAVLFTVYGHLQKLMKGDSDKPLSVAQLSAAGAMAGSIVSLVLTPVELIKCKMQMNRHIGTATQCLVHTIRTAGLSGMFKGHSATFMRETFGGAAWFGSYELVCQQLSTDGTKDSLSPLALMGAGALGGIAYNAIMFPADVVKSQIQAETTSAKPSYMKRLASLYRAEGVRGLYRGFGITLCRAVPANAVIFGTYEFALRVLSGES